MPKTLQVNPGTIIRIKIDRPIDLSSYAHGDKHRLMDEVFAVMHRNLEELRARRKADEERADPVFRWIYGRSGHPDYDSLRAAPR
jgi:hypothetical protein